MEQMLESPSSIATANTPARYQIYSAVHKGLRALMADTLLRVGKMDAEDSCETAQTLEQLSNLLTLCRSHLEHENAFLHPALERARPNAALNTAEEHIEHLHAIADLERQLIAADAATGGERAAAMHRLYLQLATFVAENMQHMHGEETDNNAVFLQYYSDAEVMALEAELVSHIPPAEMAVWLRWMIPHMNAAERLHMLGGAKLHAPRPAFEGMLALAREVLSERDWYKLERGLQAVG